jgi:hypothetical protein
VLDLNRAVLDPDVRFMQNILKVFIFMLKKKT